MLVKILFQLIGRLPLRVNHWIGAWLGVVAAKLSPRHRNTTTANVAQYLGAMTTSSCDNLLRAAFVEQGKAMTELAVAWTADIDRLVRLFAPCPEWQEIEAEIASGRSIIFVTPHLGCFDIAGRYVASRTPITALYRPPKLQALEPIMQAGRARGGATTAPADASGVRTLLKTLKHGGHIMILPDQVPAAERGGEGVWAPFFGRPAYTMTLLPRLARASDALVVYFFAERLPSGRGYQMHFMPMREPYAENRLAAATQTNQMVERLVALAPAQYLWGYNRYKQPAGAPPPPEQPSAPA